MDGRRFAQDLLAWYDRSARRLPWRERPDPYHVLVSEFMLQQTRVETVIPYFLRFMERFPSLAALAGAREEEVLKLWEGLGYYSRARNLQAAAREVEASYGGTLPDTAKDMRKLPGIGEYTAGAVASIAFGRAEPAVDGNVLRVLARLHAISGDIGATRTKREITRLAADLLPPAQAGAFNQALMELGALVCTPRNPDCNGCPVRAHCSAFAGGLQSVLPVRSARKAVREDHYAALLLRCGEAVCVQQRPGRGLLAGLWQLPLVAAEHGRTEQAAVAAARAITGGDIRPVELLGHYTHTFSHVRWTIDLFGAYSEIALCADGSFLYADAGERAALPFGQVFLRMLADHAQEGAGGYGGNHG